MIPGATPSRIMRYEDMQSLVATGYRNGSATLTAKDGILSAYSPSLQDAAWASIPVYSPRGTIIEVSCQARNDTATSQGRIFIDQYATNATDERDLLDWIELDSTDWKPQKITFSGNDMRPFSAVRLGVNGPSTGRAHFKSITVTVYNIASPSPDMRACMIKGTNGTWTLDDEEDKFANIGCYKVEIINGIIRVHYEPMQTWGRPVASAQMDIIGGKYGYILSAGNVYRNRCDVRIVNPANGEWVDPKSIKGNSWFGFTAMGI